MEWVESGESWILRDGRSRGVIYAYNFFYIFRNEIAPNCILGIFPVPENLTIDEIKAWAVAVYKMN